MKTRLSLTTLWLVCLTLTAQPQVSSQTARNILGKHFISSHQALVAWQDIDPSINLAEGNLTIPYDEETLKNFQSKTASGEGNFYLVPTIGLSDANLRKFWANYYGVSSFPEKTEVVYRLVNLKPPEKSNSAGFEKLSNQMISNDGNVMPAMAYLETIATIYLVNRENLSPKFGWLMLSDSEDMFGPRGPLINFDGELTLAYSAFIAGSCHEVVISYFPKENFISGDINNHRLTLLATEADRTESMILVPLKNISCFAGDSDYFVGLCWYVKPKWQN